MKSAMIVALHQKTTDHPRRIAFNPMQHQNQLSDFAFKNTKHLVIALDIPKDFFDKETRNMGQ